MFSSSVAADLKRPIRVGTEVVRKKFDDGYFRGVVTEGPYLVRDERTGKMKECFLVVYSDDDREHLTFKELLPILQEDVTVFLAKDLLSFHSSSDPSIRAQSLLFNNFSGSVSEVKSISLLHMDLSMDQYMEMFSMMRSASWQGSINRENVKRCLEFFLAMKCRGGVSHCDLVFRESFLVPFQQLPPDAFSERNVIEFMALLRDCFHYDIRVSQQECFGLSESEQNSLRVEMSQEQALSIFRGLFDGAPQLFTFGVVRDLVSLFGTFPPFKVRAWEVIKRRLPVGISRVSLDELLGGDVSNPQSLLRREGNPELLLSSLVFENLQFRAKIGRITQLVSDGPDPGSLEVMGRLGRDPLCSGLFPPDWGTAVVAIVPAESESSGEAESRADAL